VRVQVEALQLTVPRMERAMAADAHHFLLALQLPGRVRAAAPPAAELLVQLDAPKCRQERHPPPSY